VSSEFAGARRRGRSTDSNFPKEIPEIAKKKSSREPLPVEPETKADEDDFYAGISLAGAQARLGDLSEEACAALPVDKLCALGVLTALFLDQHFDDYGPWKDQGDGYRVLKGKRQTRLSAAEKAEKTEMGQWWQEFARKNADIHGA
jgi:hypothetical protein